MIHSFPFLNAFLNFFDTGLGTLVFVIFYALWVNLLLPGSWLSMTAGVLYGSFFGTFLVFLGASLGASITFLVGRKFLRNSIQKLISRFSKLQLAQKIVRKEGLKFIILTRLSPIFPFSILNIIYSLSEVDFKSFCIGLIAILPGTFLYCSLGSLAGDISNFDQILANRDKLTSFVFSLIGICSTCIVIWLGSKASREVIHELDESI